jgi:endonuclease YncB( thermonuclease family)
MTKLLAILSLACLQAPPAHATKPWQTLDGCRLVEHGANDGDSFRVRWNDEEFTFRIYFADTPEVYARQRDRVSAQADYFGITVEQAVEVGRLARQFTQNALQNGFSVRTRWQGVYGGDRVVRKYGTVTVNGQDLAELLVANGLARIHGVGIGGETREEVARLRALEAKAKAAGRGAWGMGAL